MNVLMDLFFSIKIFFFGDLEFGNPELTSFKYLIHFYASFFLPFFYPSQPISFNAPNKQVFVKHLLYFFVFIYLIFCNTHKHFDFDYIYYYDLFFQIALTDIHYFVNLLKYL